ncbi:hypothetical protein [uncultured Rhodospira sp.]|uniref:hypothetical protein n=1 Tax=uncultured Rhodospira sp. TaxID=1936189 RepID=UPI0026399F86|nr:hypothetical protein [uncultured Rhodospira sp.]
MRPRIAVAAAAPLIAFGLLFSTPTAHAQSSDGSTAPPADGGGSGIVSNVTMGQWRIHHIPELRLGQPTIDPATGAIYHPVAITGTSISFYVIGAGEQELWEVPVIWAGDQPTGNKYHKLDYFGILEETGGLYIYSRETE